MKKIIYLTPLVVLVVVIFLFILYAQHLGKQVIYIKTAYNTHELSVDVADTDQERSRGLMGVENLADNEGMLFVYEQDVVTSYWMKDMKMPIDMIFINSDYKIEYIKKYAQPCTPEFQQCPHYGTSVPIRYVLEVKAGFTEKNNLQIADELIIK